MGHILITGGAGFIGSALVRHVLEHTPHDVEVLDAFTPAANPASLTDLGPRLTITSGTVTDSALVDTCLSRADLVVHLAAESHVDLSLTNPAAFVMTNVIGTATLLEAVRRHDVRFHHVSTDEVYGDLPHNASPVAAGAAYRPSSPYSATKASADHLVQAWVRSFGVAATISICTNNYGPRQHVEKFIPRQITTLLDGGRPQLYGDGSPSRDWLAVDDHCSAIWAIANHGRIGTAYHVSAGDERSNREIAGDLLDLFGQPRDQIDYVADRPGHDQRYALDATILRDELGWAPRIDFPTGLARTVAWYRDHESWWRPTKADVEARYAAHGQ
ncbi:MAG: dTDP-glucose 4,6-dehydratase [Propionibacteriaceae bacterium]